MSLGFPYTHPRWLPRFTICKNGHTIAIKHVFPCINSRLVPKEVLKTEGTLTLAGFRGRFSTAAEEPSEC